MTNLTIRLELRSDGAFSQGPGHGKEVDQEISHDPRTGLTLLAGTALKRLAAKGCATIFGALLAQTVPRSDERWIPLADAAGMLFGAPGSTHVTDGVVRFDAATYPEVVQALVRAAIQGRFMDPYDVLRAVTERRFRTATDDETGAPLDASLRVVRVALAGTTLFAGIHADRSLSELERALLASSLRAGLRRAGLHRTRGSGRLEPTLLDDGRDVTDASLKHFETYVTSPYYPPPRRQQRERGEAADATSVERLSDAAEKAYVVPVTITLDQPVLTARLGAEPNSAVGEDHLPGSVLRGRAVEAYKTQHDLAKDADLPVDPRAHSLFFNPSRVRYLPAYPLMGDERFLPTPRSFATPKGQEEFVVDLAVASLDDAAKMLAEEKSVRLDAPGGREGNEAWKSVRAPFVAFSGSNVGTYAPERRAREHIRTDPAYGRPREGGLFLYDALAPGQQFKAFVWCASTDLAGGVRALLSGRADIGRAKSADYGGVTIEVGEPEPARTWHEASSRDTPSDALTVWFLSDTLIRDYSGRHRADAGTITDALARALGCPLTLREKRGAFLAAGPAGGYNGVWGHGLTQQQAVMRGSVLVYDPPPLRAGDSSLEERLRSLERDGLGDRREEGFGRLAFNRLVTARFAGGPESRAAASQVSPAPPSSEGEGKALERIARAMLRQRIAPKISRRARTLAPHLSECSRSLLGRLREAFRNAGYQPPSEGRAHLSTFLDRLAAPARDALSGRSAGDDSFLDWFQSRAGGRNTWGELELTAGHLPDFGTYRPWDTLEDLPGKEAFRADIRLAHDTLALASRLSQHFENDSESDRSESDSA